jgi:hypothetical protein
MKFAVIIILIFAAMMTVGTFLESYYGTEFANRTLYKKWPFILVQFAMFLSIFLAAFIRMPPKKRLYGFYTIHSGLIMLGCGSFITWYSGVDGQVILRPNDPTRRVYLDEDLLTLTYPNQGKTVEKIMPSSAFETQIDETYEEITLGRYYPYSERVLNWIPPRLEHPNPERAVDLHSAQYMLFNDRVSEEMILTLHPEADTFKSNVTMGPLSVHFLPAGLGKCFDLDNPSKLILWDARKSSCFTPEERGIEMQKGESGNDFFVVQEKDGENYSFFPDYSPYPLSRDFNSVQRDSHLRLFNRKLFQKDPHLFLFGEALSYYDEDEDVWVVKSLNKTSLAELPWMGLQVRLLQYEKNLIPKKTPQYTLPIQKNNEMIRGRERALELVVKNKSFWVTNQQPISLMIDGVKVEARLSKKTIFLPFEFVLERFNMDTDPGTRNPASYESFVKLFTPEGVEKHHVFMNNPLKHKGFTFYQASYSQNPETGTYNSTLSANVDQGRPLKYLGSIFLVFGAAWHYQITRRKKRLKPDHSILKGLDSEKDSKDQRKQT